MNLDLIWAWITTRRSSWQVGHWAGQTADPVVVDFLLFQMAVLTTCSQSLEKAVAKSKSENF